MRLAGLCMIFESTALNRYTQRKVPTVEQVRQVARGGTRDSRDGKNEQGVDEEQHCVEGMNGTGGRGEAPPPSMPSFYTSEILEVLSDGPLADGTAPSLQCELSTCRTVKTALNTSACMTAGQANPPWCTLESWNPFTILARAHAKGPRLDAPARKWRRKSLLYLPP